MGKIVSNARKLDGPNRQAARIIMAQPERDPESLAVQWAKLHCANNPERLDSTAQPPAIAPRAPQVARNGSQRSGSEAK